MYKKYSMHNNTYIDRTINPKQKELLHTLIDTVFDHLGKKVLAPYMRTFREDFTY
ncbi:hypothetical protein GW750_05410 [bacterium]|nr:hypothetical protein [bacterium]